MKKLNIEIKIDVEITLNILNEIKYIIIEKIKLKIIIKYCKYFL